MLAGPSNRHHDVGRFRLRRGCARLRWAIAFVPCSVLSRRFHRSAVVEVTVPAMSTTQSLTPPDPTTAAKDRPPARTARAAITQWWDEDRRPGRSPPSPNDRDSRYGGGGQHLVRDTSRRRARADLASRAGRDSTGALARRGEYCSRLGDVGGGRRDLATQGASRVAAQGGGTRLPGRKRRLRARPQLVPYRGLCRFDGTGRAAVRRCSRQVKLFSLITDDHGLWRIHSKHLEALLDRPGKHFGAGDGSLGSGPGPVFDSSWLPGIVRSLDVNLSGRDDRDRLYGAHRISILRVQVHEARRLGQYLLRDRLGGGGMGEVFRAEHALLRNR